MSEPAGWQWIEAWRNGTISDDDFHSLQILLREQPAARRTLRRSMAMDTALRDRAEARLLAAESETASDEQRASPVTAPRFRVVRREVVAWSAAAACLLLARICVEPQAGERSLAGFGPKSACSRPASSRAAPGHRFGNAAAARHADHRAITRSTAGLGSRCAPHPSGEWQRTGC